MKDAEAVLARVAAAMSTQAKKISVQDLRTRNEDPAINHARLLAAYRLYTFFKHDADRVVSKLGCSLAYIKIAEKIANLPDPEGVAFRKELQDIEGTVVVAEKPADDPAKEQDEKTGSEHLDPVEMMFLIAKRRYGLERKDLVSIKPSSKSRSIRRVIAYVAKRVFDMEAMKIAIVLRCDRQTITGYLTEAFEDYGSDGKFTREVDEACKSIGITIKSKRPRSAA